MCILREMWSKEGVGEDVSTVYEYVFDLRNRIAETCDLASQNLRSAQGIHKQHFDKKAKMRKLVAGDQILILLPTNHNKLIMKWKGPFEVLQKIGETDYKLQIGNVQKVFHINMLKKYIQREAIETGLAISVIDDSDENHLNGLEFPGVTNSGERPNFGKDLTADQVNDLVELFHKFEPILSDQPGKTHLIEHSIELNTPDPIRVRPYPIPFAKVKAAEEEID